MPTGMTPTARDTCFTGTINGRTVRVLHEPWTDCSGRCKAETARRCDHPTHRDSLQCARCGCYLRRVPA